MKKKIVKLQLNRTTVLKLAPAENLDKAPGGHSEYPCTDSCQLRCVIEQNTGRWCA